MMTPVSLLKVHIHYRTSRLNRIGTGLSESPLLLIVLITQSYVDTQSCFKEPIVFHSTQ